MDGTAISSETHVPLLRYDGRIGELYRIFLVNILLTIVTFGIFRFWAITRMRRYMWSRMAAQGERFEYDGTGGQLFVGFLLAGLILLGAGLAAVALGYALEQVWPGLGIAAFVLVDLVVVLLALAALFSAQRYRLSHTLWCGIRGGMEGSAIAYGLRSLWYGVACLLTLYQLAPWASLRLLERRINASFAGDLRFASRGSPGKLYLRFLLAFVLTLVLAAIVASGVFALAGPALGLMLQLKAHPDLARDPDAMRQITRLPYVFGAGYLALFVGAALIGCGYVAAFWRHVTGHTQLGTLRFGSDVSGARLLGFQVVNLLILLFTLGLGMPIVIHRRARFLSAHLLAVGTLDGSSLRQSDRPVPRFSEGMFQQLDGGSGIL